MAEYMRGPIEGGGEMGPVKLGLAERKADRLAQHDMGGSYSPEFLAAAKGCMECMSNNDAEGMARSLRLAMDAYEAEKGSP